MERCCTVLQGNRFEYRQFSSYQDQYHCGFPLNGHHSPTHSPSLFFFLPGLHMQSGDLGNRGSTMHKACSGHVKFFGQDNASDKTKRIKIYDGFYI